MQGRRFKRLYCCLGPLKDGFRSGCKPLLGLDGCHLRGAFRGILLNAVAIDPNDGMYPVAWAQVEAENNQSWDWFLGLLKDDLGIVNDAAFTFISDKQKVWMPYLLYSILLMFHAFNELVFMLLGFCECTGK